MRDAESPITARVVGAVLLACCLQAGICWALSDETPLKSTNENPQADDEMSKRFWNTGVYHHMWNKRGWNNLHEGWGRKRSVPSSSFNDQPAVEKRAWSSLQSGWGKRLSPDDEYAVRQLANMLDRADYDEYNPDADLELNDDEKRNWGQFHGGWGKRSRWDNFRGSWGKREPAWSNLKGIWGKRSGSDQVAQ